MDTVSVIKNRNKLGGEQVYRFKFHNSTLVKKISYRQFHTLDEALIHFYDMKGYLPKKIWNSITSKHENYDVTPKIMNYVLKDSQSLKEFLNVFSQFNDDDAHVY